MSKKTAGKVCLIFGLAAIAWSAWPDHRSGSAPEENTFREAHAEVSKGFASWIPSSLAKLAQPFLSKPFSSDTAVAAPMSASDVAAATANPDAPPVISDASQEALQAESLMQAGSDSVPTNAPSRMAPASSNRAFSAQSADPAADPASNLPVAVLPNPAEKKSSGHSGSISSSSSSSSSTGLKNEDYVALLSPMKASFEDRMAEVFGSVCAIDTQVCAQPAKNPLHTLRWNQEEGLNRHVGFAIKSIGPALQFDLSLRIQKSTSNEEAIALNLSPLSIDAQNESVNGKTLRVMDFRFADFQIRGETMTNVHARMVFESTDSGLVPTADSRFEFNRSKVGIAMTKWEPDAVVTASTDPALPSFPDLQNQPVWSEEEYGRKPSSESGSYFLADELLFSIKVEKS